MVHLQPIRQVGLVLILFLFSFATAATKNREFCGCLKDCITHQVFISGQMRNFFHGLCGENSLPTSLDLNLCMGNQNGILSWQDHGGGPDSCDCKSRKDDTVMMDCSCRNDSGGTTENSIDMSEGIHYDNDRGVLYCYMNYGTNP